MSDPVRLVLVRDVFGAEATLGRLSIDGDFFGYVCEDQDRGLDRSMPLAEIKRRKVRAETAVPATNDGAPYRVGIRFSPKHGRVVLYLEDVPGFRFIEIHSGNKESQTEGCQLAGTTRDVATMTVGHSKPAVEWLERKLIPLVRAGVEVTYAIVREPGVPLAAPYR